MSQFQQPNQMTSRWIVRYLGWHFGWHGNIMAPDHPKMILSIGTGCTRAKCPWVDSQSGIHDLPIQA